MSLFPYESGLDVNVKALSVEDSMAVRAVSSICKQ